MKKSSSGIVRAFQRIFKGTFKIRARHHGDDQIAVIWLYIVGVVCHRRFEGTSPPPPPYFVERGGTAHSDRLWMPDTFLPGLDPACPPSLAAPSASGERRRRSKAPTHTGHPCLCRVYVPLLPQPPPPNPHAVPTYLYLGHKLVA